MVAKGINVNAIASGYIATNNNKALRDNPERNITILSRIPQKRWENRRTSEALQFS
ncbi:MAG: hypothetical protein WBA74_05880 [Cyclobacteriaceae bacterium]